MTDRKSMSDPSIATVKAAILDAAEDVRAGHTLNDASVLYAALGAIVGLEKMVPAESGDEVIQEVIRKAPADQQGESHV